jgi:hypothetical protein
MKKIVQKSLAVGTPLVVEQLVLLSLVVRPPVVVEIVVDGVLLVAVKVVDWVVLVILVQAGEPQPPVLVVEIVVDGVLVAVEVVGWVVLAVLVQAGELQPPVVVEVVVNGVLVAVGVMGVYRLHHRRHQIKAYCDPHSLGLGFPDRCQQQQHQRLRHPHHLQPVISKQTDTVLKLVWAGDYRSFDVMPCCLKTGAQIPIPVKTQVFTKSIHTGTDGSCCSLHLNVSVVELNDGGVDCMKFPRSWFFC